MAYHCTINRCNVMYSRSQTAIFAAKYDRSLQDTYHHFGLLLSSFGHYSVSYAYFYFSAYIPKRFQVHVRYISWSVVGTYLLTYLSLSLSLNRKPPLSSLYGVLLFKAQLITPRNSFMPTKNSDTRLVQKVRDRELYLLDKTMAGILRPWENKQHYIRVRS